MPGNSTRSLPYDFQSRLIRESTHSLRRWDVVCKWNVATTLIPYYDRPSGVQH